MFSTEFEQAILLQACDIDLFQSQEDCAQQIMRSEDQKHDFIKSEIGQKVE
jgi:hypothetical protein